MRPLLSAVAVGVARAVDMVAVAVQLLAFAALPCDGARVVEASAEVAEKPRAAIPATNVAASLVPAFIRMPCSSHHPVSSTRGWPLPLVSAYPAQAGAGPGTAAVPSGASAVPAAAARTDPTPCIRRRGGLLLPLAAGITPQPSSGAVPLAEPGHIGPVPKPGQREAAFGKSARWRPGPGRGAGVASTNGAIWQLSWAKMPHRH